MELVEKYSSFLVNVLLCVLQNFVICDMISLSAFVSIYRLFHPLVFFGFLFSNMFF